MDCFLWDYVEDRAYEPPLKHQVYEVVTSDEQETLRKDRDEFLYCLDFVRITNEVHTEYL